MWQLNENGQKMLECWIKECNDRMLKKKASGLLKKSSAVMCYDELKELLEPFIDNHRVYKIIDELQLKHSKAEKQIDPIYLERIERLKRLQEEKRYREMTKSVDPNQIYGRVNFTRGFGEEIRSANRNLVAVFNTLLTVGGAFIFGFYGIQYAYPNLNLNNMVRVTIGLILATIVFFADIYFIITRMDDLGEKPIQV